MKCASSAATRFRPLVVTGDAPLRANGEFLTGTEVTFQPSLSTFATVHGREGGKRRLEGDLGAGQELAVRPATAHGR